MNSTKNYLIYTSSGFIQEQNGNDTENLQILGWGSGINEAEAVQSFCAQEPDLAVGYSDYTAQEIVISKD